MKLIASIIVFFLVTACNNFDQKKLIGRYVWNDGRLDTLEIRMDGSYEYWSHGPGTKIKNYGKWNFNSLINEVEFELENFPFIKIHEEGKSFFSHVRIREGKIHLMYQPEPDTYLIQIDSPGRKILQ